MSARRFTVLVSFERAAGTPVETRRIHIGAATEEEAIDIATGVAVILSAGPGVGSVDSVCSHETDPRRKQGIIDDALTIEEAIIWAVTVGQPGLDAEEPDAPEPCGRILFITKHGESPSCPHTKPCPVHDTSPAVSR
jgi:hypothetical protein